MEPSEFLNPNNTVYKYNQCITEEDLRTALETVLSEYEATPPAFMLERDRIAIVIKTLDYLLEWITTGKANDFRIM